MQSSYRAYIMDFNQTTKAQALWDLYMEAVRLRLSHQAFAVRKSYNRELVKYALGI